MNYQSYSPFEVTSTIASGRPVGYKKEASKADVGVSYISKSSLKNMTGYLQNPTQLMTSMMTPSMFPREPKIPQKSLISSSVRSRRYKKESSTSSKRYESPKSQFTRK
jgi:hypothetical protein